MELVLGYATSPRSERFTLDPTAAGGEELGRALLLSPDDTLIQVPPAWTRWLRDHLGVRHEWCTSWYGMSRVEGVNSRVVGDLPKVLTGGAVQRAWDHVVGKEESGQWSHGVTSVRGWARTGYKGEKGAREGYVTPLFQHLVQQLRQSQKAQYMFVAVHEEGKKDLRGELQRAGASIMLEVPDGKMGHREAWWPLDKYFGEARDWAWKMRGPASSEKESVWLVRLGGASWPREAHAGEARQPAIRELERLGTYYVAGGLAGLELQWGKKDAGRVLLDEDREYTRSVGVWLGLTAAPPSVRGDHDHRGTLCPCY